MRGWARIGVGVGALLALMALACGAEGTLYTEVTPVGVVSPPAEETRTPPQGEVGVVTFVVDGDTVDVVIGGQTYRVRYIGVNTPERDEACYREAAEANLELVLDQTVTLVPDVSDTDRYGRLLRYVYVGDVFVNERLVAEGWAEAVSYAPDTTYADHFQALEQAAAAAGLGCHPTGIFDDGSLER